MNKFGTILILINALVLFLAPASQAGTTETSGVGDGYIEFSFLPVWKSTNTLYSSSGGGFEGQPDPGKETDLGIDTRAVLGYAVGGRWLIGFSYNMYRVGTKRGDGAQPKEGSTAITEYGPALGVLHGGWKVIVSYVLASEWKYSMKYADPATGATVSDQTYENKGGKGFLVNIGYNVTLTSWLQIGPSLIYRNVAYDKGSLEDRTNPSNSYTDQTFASKAVQADLSPYFSIVARF